MTSLLDPGGHRAAGILDDAALLTAMVAVEQAWLDALVAAGVAPGAAAADLSGLVDGADVPALAEAAEAGGTPVGPLVALLRERTGGPASTWLHRGLTSQDVVDTALVLATRDAAAHVAAQLRTQVGLLVALARRHEATPAVARTLTQHAVPTLFGVRVAGWLDGVLGAARGLDRARGGLPVQLGGAVGTLAAAVELAGGGEAGRRAAGRLVDLTAAHLGLEPARPWHVVRRPVVALGDALVGCTDAWGHLAADVLVLSRSEVGEASEASGGGSSTMPHKANPVLSVLLRRAALTAPGLGQVLHLASATAVDERSDGAWHAEWDTLVLLGRRVVVAAGQATDLLAGLQVDASAMAATLAAAEGLDAEQEAMARLAGHRPALDYTGIGRGLVDDAVLAATAWLEEDA